MKIRKGDRVRVLTGKEDQPQTSPKLDGDNPRVRRREANRRLGEVAIGADQACIGKLPIGVRRTNVGIDRIEPKIIPAPVDLDAATGRHNSLLVVLFALFCIPSGIVIWDQESVFCGGLGEVFETLPFDGNIAEQGARSLLNSHQSPAVVLLSGHSVVDGR